VLAALLPATLGAEITLTPEQAVALALQKNTTLTAASARVAVAEGLRVQAGLKPNPRLIIQTENTRVTGSVPFRYGQDTDNFGYVSQVLESGGKRQGRLDLAGENVHASELSAAAQRTQLAGRVLTAYWNAVGARQLTNMLAESLSVLERTVQYHRDRVKEGLLPEADLIRVQLEYDQVSISFRNAEQDARRSLLTLYREIGVAPEPAVSLTGDLGEVPPIAPVDLDQAVERRPDVRLAAQGVHQAQAATRLQKANAKPDPEVLFGYKRTAGFNTMIAGVQINLPVRNKNQGAIAAAAAEETSAAATLQATRTAARTEIEALQSDYDQKRQLVEQSLPSMRSQAAETRRIADAVYREGASDLLRLLDAEHVRIQTETLYIRNMLDYRLAAVSLQIALGLLP
jgi:outer membrane protein, heavy metal efflux system